MGLLGSGRQCPGFPTWRAGHSDVMEREREREPGQEPHPPTDPYTPEPGPTRGERRAFRVLPLAWIGVAVLAGIILYAVFT